MYQIAYKAPTKGTQYVRTFKVPNEERNSYTLTPHRALATSFSSQELADLYVSKIVRGVMGPGLCGRLLYVEQES